VTIEIFLTLRKKGELAPTLAESSDFKLELNEVRCYKPFRGCMSAKVRAPATTQNGELGTQN